MRVLEEELPKLFREIDVILEIMDKNVFRDSLRAKFDRESG